jgi:hypothetical protein
MGANIMTLNDLLNSDDTQFLIGQIAFNINQMKTKYNLTDEDLTIANENIMKIYDAGITASEIEENKHGKFYTLTAFRYYNSITDTFAQMQSKAHGRQTKYSIYPITQRDIYYHLENMCIGTNQAKSRQVNIRNLN